MLKKYSRNKINFITTVDISFQFTRMPRPMTLTKQKLISVYHAGHRRAWVDACVLKTAKVPNANIVNAMGNAIYRIESLFAGMM